MSLPTKRIITVFITLTLVTSGTAGVASATTDVTSSAQPKADQAATESECAATPPADHSDPPSDVIGWENGTWYDATLGVNQSDGVNSTEQRAIVARTMARVEALRCIEFDESVPVSVTSRAEYLESDTVENFTGGEHQCGTPRVR